MAGRSMIGILFFVAIAVWLVVAVLLSKRVPRWLGITKYTTAASLLLFPLVLTAPIADELIGRWQFSRLCEREAVVTLSPDWGRVKRARHNNNPIAEIGGYVIPVRAQRVEYVDVDTGKLFLTYKAFHTYGGFLFGRLGLGLGQSTSCWPKDWIEVTNKLNTDQLLKRGETK